MEAKERGEEIDEAGQELLNGEAPVLPVHNVKECEEKFDLDNPDIVIPEPVVPEKDNDWILSEEQAEQQIASYLEKKG